jgi:transcriptional regulator with XRE-family HTH domain
MKLKEWRQTHEKTLRECAEVLGLGDARVYQRYESGEQWPSAPTVEAILEMTANSVTVVDLHEQRVEWIKANRPDVVFMTRQREAAE